MTFPNAYQGVNKLFTAELMRLIAGVLLILTVVISVVTNINSLVSSGNILIGTGIVFIIVLIATYVFYLIASCLKIYGLRQASSDEENFGPAFIIALFALLLGAAAAVFTTFNLISPAIDNVFQTFSKICDIFVIIFVIRGITVLAEKLGNESVAKMGSTIMVLYIVFYGIAAVSNLIPAFFGTNLALATLEAILGIVGGVVSIVAYIIYMVYIGKARAMLQAK